MPRSTPARWRNRYATAIVAVALCPFVFGQPAASRLSTADAARLRQALAAYDQGRAAQAQPALEELLARHPANYEINETLGLIHAEAGDMPAALPLLEHAARLEPRTALARANLGAAYLKLNQPQQALPELEAAAHLQPRDQQTQANLAHGYMQAGQPAKASAAFATAAVLGPLDADTGHDRALALLESGDAAGAMRVLDALPAASRTDATEELEGEAEERLGHYQQAEQHFSQAAHLNPAEPNIYAWTVELLRHFSWQPAADVASYGAKLYPASTRLKAAEGIAYYAENRYKEGAQVFAGLLAADPDNANWANLLGHNCALLADATPAGCDGLERFAAEHPKNAEAATYAATSLLHQPAEKRQDARARALLEQAIAADPTLPDAWYQLGVLEQEQTRWQESVAPLQKAISLQPAMAEAHYRLARAYAHLGRREDAAAEIALQQRYAKQEKDKVDTRLKEITTFLVATP